MGKNLRVATALTVALGAFALATAPVLAAATSYPDDYFFARGEQWALTGATSSINAPAAWCASTGAGVTVAMIDTGADFNHPELANKLIPGVSFTGPTAQQGTSLTDVEGHGTGTTGVVVADTNNSQGIAAVAPDASALVVNVSSSDGSIYDNDVASGIEWAANHGANIINVSIEPGRIKAGSTTQGDPTIPAAVLYASQKGVAVTLAVGNNSSSQAVYPNMNGIAFVVGALAPDGTMSSFSNHGSDVNIWAPGGTTMDTSQMTIANSIVTLDTQSSGYQYAIADGTSISAPLVAGTLALLMQNGRMTAQQAMAAVSQGTVTRNGLPELDAARALGVPDSQRCGTPPSTPTGGPPPLGKGGGSGGVIIRSTTTTTTTHHSTSTALTTTQQQTTLTTTSTSTSSDDPGGAGTVQSPGDTNDKGGRPTLPPADATPSGGFPAPLVIGGLGLLLAGGGPLGVRVLRARRGRGVTR